MCELQAAVFEGSINFMNTSSEIFIRRFMKSQIVKQLDDESILESNSQPKDILQQINEEYGISDYGSVKYSSDEMYWIGYLYRYFAATYELTSARIYKLFKPKELREVFPAYHTLDPAQAIERLLEAKNLQLDDSAEFRRQYEILKKIRSAG